MKNNLSKKIILSFILLLGISLSFSFKNYVDIVNTLCGTAFHGIIEDDTHCTEDVTITSLPEDSYGTIVRASITSDTRVLITPGTSSVKLMPGYNGHTWKVRQSANKEDGEEGNGGNTGKTGDDLIKDPSFTINNQKLTINNLNSPITHYYIYDIYGILITEVNQTQPLDYQIPLSHLNSSIYIIILQLENGDLFQIKIAF